MAVATDVYRLGRRDVHHAFRFGSVVFEHDSCRLDGKGNAWLPAAPPGPRCPTCFGMAGAGDRGPGRKPAVGRPATLATIGAVLLGAVVFGTSLGEPVNFFPTASGDVTSAPSASVTPGPFAATPLPTEAPVLTPTDVPFTVGPTDVPLPTFVLPTFPPLPTYPPVPTFGPLPTWPPFPVPLPTIASPLPVPCIHPGTHLGVDSCKWPHN